MYRDGYIIPCLKKFFYWHFKILDNSEVATYNEDIKRSENAIKKEDAYMAENNKIYITANELAEMLGVSVGHAYKLIRKLNQELEKEGFLVIAGKVPRRYFEKRWYGFSV
jgi:DNA polymerase III delta prime subunit